MKFKPEAGELFLAKNESFFDGWKEVRCLCSVEKEQGVNSLGVVLFSWNRGREHASCWIHADYVKKIEVEKSVEDLKCRSYWREPSHDNVRESVGKIDGYDATKFKDVAGSAFSLILPLWVNGFNFKEIVNLVMDNPFIMSMINGPETSPIDIELHIDSGVRLILGNDASLAKDIKNENNKLLQEALTLSGELVTLKTADYGKAERLSKICKSIAES